MARKTRTIEDITDDLTGEALSEDEAVNISFSYGGDHYSIDLSKKNAEKFDAVMAPYIDNARKEYGQYFARPKKGNAKKPARSQGPVREWASKNGYELNPKGRIPKAVLEAYDKANS